MGKGAEKTTLPGIRDCEYQAPGSFTGGVTIYDDEGIKDVTGRTQLKNTKINGRDAVQGVSPAGICSVAMKIDESSRVEASAGARANEQKACEVANQIAQLVEPKLPK